MNPELALESTSAPFSPEPAHDEPSGTALTRAPSWVWDVVAYAEPIVAAPVIGAGVLALANRGPRFLRRHPVAFGLAAVGGVALLAKWQLDRFLADTPRYEVEGEVNGLEIRRYAPRVIASTSVDGADWDASLEEGFRRLAGYIFGGNDRRERIAMTAPVNVSRSHTEEAGPHVVTFTMPRKLRIEHLPEPDDARVELLETPGEKLVALRFRGRYSAENVHAKTTELMSRVASAGLEPIGVPSFAGYDAPSTLPFLRRNEVWVKVH